MSRTRVQMVVFDWAGTTADHGSIAPIVALEQVFAAAKVPVTRDLLRLSMGIAKKDHIRQVLSLPQVREDWATMHHTEPDERDVEALYAGFTPRMMDAIGPSSVLIPGVAPVAEELRRRGVRIGATTGYTRPMLDRLLAPAASQGYAPDLSLCPDDAPGGRPWPWMCYRLAIELQVTALWQAVKIGDTESDIAEGINAGIWPSGSRGPAMAWAARSRSGKRLHRPPGRAPSRRPRRRCGKPGLTTSWRVLLNPSRFWPR